VPMRLNNAVLFIDATTGLDVAALFGNMNEPTAVAFNAAGTELWVANKFGDGADTGSVAVFDVNADTLITEILHDAFAEPEGIAIANGKAFVSNRTRGTLTIIDVATYTVIDSVVFGLAYQPSHVIATPDGNNVYVSTGTNTVFKVNTTSYAATPITLAAGSSRNMAVTPDGAKVYVALQNSNVGVIQVSNDAVTNLNFTSVISSYGVGISADGTRGFVTDQSGGKVVVFDTSTGLEITASRFPITGFTTPRAIIAK
jgi:YVTN family beta-propeller protein